jgi:hypothetical protein
MKMGAKLVKVVFKLDAAEWHRSSTESLWAESVGGDRFRLRNVPFFAFGVSNQDVVFAEEMENTLFFKAVSLRGGHSTYRLRLLVTRSSERFEESWRPLKDLGCSYEEGAVLAVDVPPAADIYAVYSALDAGEGAGVWDFEEGHCGHPLNGSATRK